MHIQNVLKTFESNIFTQFSSKHFKLYMFTPSNIEQEPSLSVLFEFSVRLGYVLGPQMNLGSILTLVVLRSLYGNFLQLTHKGSTKEKLQVQYVIILQLLFV